MSTYNICLFVGFFFFFVFFFFFFFCGEIRKLTIHFDQKIYVVSSSGAL